MDIREGMPQPPEDDEPVPWWEVAAFVMPLLVMFFGMLWVLFLALE